MESFGVEAISEIAQKKQRLFDSSLSRYFVYAMMAGVFCSLGMILAYTAAGNLYAYEATKGVSTIVFGISFALSFTLIVFSGSELFTGNVLVMTMAAMNKRMELKKALAILGVCYIANFAGATLASLLIGQTGLLNSEIVGEYLVQKAAMKMNLSFGEAFARGVLCNMMVCFATWSTAKMKSESAKLLVLIWCVYAFCTSGFEHSIANMALFVMATLSSFVTPEISAMGYMSNMIPVTIGNIVGGAVVVAGAYFYVAGEAKVSIID